MRIILFVNQTTLKFLHPCKQVIEPTLVAENCQQQQRQYNQCECHNEAVGSENAVTACNTYKRYAQAYEHHTHLKDNLCHNNYSLIINDTCLTFLLQRYSFSATYANSFTLFNLKYVNRN